MEESFRITKEVSHPILDFQEKAYYARRIMNGDTNARNAMVESYAGLIRSIATGYAKSCNNSRIEQDDLESVGYIGLIKAVDNLRTDETEAINAYFISSIIGEIKHYIRDHFLALHFSRATRELTLYTLQKAKEKFVANNDREPSIKELAILLGKDEKIIVEALEANNMLVSIDYVIPDGEADGPLLLETLGDNSNSTEDDMAYSIDLEQFISSISNNRMRQVFILYYCQGLLQREIGCELGYSPGEISRNTIKGLEEAKKYFKEGYK